MSTGAGGGGVVVEQAVSAIAPPRRIPNVLIASFSLTSRLFRRGNRSEAPRFLLWNIHAGSFERFPERLQGIEIRRSRAHQFLRTRLSNLGGAQRDHDSFALEIGEAVRV